MGLKAVIKPSSSLYPHAHTLTAKGTCHFYRYSLKISKQNKSIHFEQMFLRPSASTYCHLNSNWHTRQNLIKLVPIQAMVWVMNINIHFSADTERRNKMDLMTEYTSILMLNLFFGYTIYCWVVVTKVVLFCTSRLSCFSASTVRCNGFVCIFFTFI